MTALREMVGKTVEHTIETFMAGARLEPSRFFIIDPARLEKHQGTTISIADEWRRTRLERYHPGSWKHTVIDLVAFEIFRPSEFYAEHKAVLAERHPHHQHLESGLANTLAELVRDGVLAKMGTGRYAPAISGVPFL